jgi:hypothetical protein
MTDRRRAPGLALTTDFDGLRHPCARSALFLMMATILATSFRGLVTFLVFLAAMKKLYALGVKGDGTVSIASCRDLTIPAMSAALA